MKKHDNNASVQLLFLLRQQRYLYHQLKILTDRQRKLGGANSPELLLEIVSGRRKLIEKLRQLNDKLQPIKANWQRLFSRLEPECKAKAHKMVNQSQQIISQILAAGAPETTRNPAPEQDWIFDEVLAQVRTGSAFCSSLQESGLK